jgi:hypothetical protein
MVLGGVFGGVYLKVEGDFEGVVVRVFPDSCFYEFIRREATAVYFGICVVSFEGFAIDEVFGGGLARSGEVLVEALETVDVYFEFSRVVGYVEGVPRVAFYGQAVGRKFVVSQTSRVVESKAVVDAQVERVFLLQE